LIKRRRKKLDLRSEPVAATGTGAVKSNLTRNRETHYKESKAKVYEWAVLPGVNYWINLISSLIIADFFNTAAGAASS